VKIDRAIQLEILQAAAASYPDETDVQVFEHLLESHGTTTMAANLKYLESHGLISGGLVGGMGGNYSFGCPEITKDGIDFLADDGGLTAILNVVTIKIHEDSLRALLLQRAESLPDAAPEERSALSEAIRSLPARSIQTVADKLIGLGVEHLPNATHALHTWITQAIASTPGIAS
jgi:hypothetical protein